MDDAEWYQQSAPPPRRGPGFVGVVLTSIVTSAVMFFGLRELDKSGILGGGPAKPAPAVTAEVPTLVGLRIEQARELLKAKGLLLAITEEREDAQQAAGFIAAQTPLAGSQVAAGSTVGTVVSKGIAAVVVPNVAGLKPEDAIAKLNEKLLQAGAQKQASSDTVALGLVVATEPAAGATAAPKAAVSLIVSTGPAGAEVPKVVGISLSKAKKAIEAAGFKVGKTKYTYDNERAGLVVLKQEPAEGTKAAPGATINLLVNEGD